MILISHRGNIDGKVPEMENNPTYIYNALSAGFHVEIDVWYKGGEWYLGHDEPTYPTNLGYLKNDKLWCHAKNIEALNMMTSFHEIHSFWHQEDDVTLTSRKFLWTYPGKQLTENSIAVLPELNNDNSLTMLPKKVLGICSDFIVNYKETKNVI